MNRLFRRGTFVEQVLYEASPVFYLMLSVFVLSQEQIPMYGRAAAFVLLLTGLTILALRFEYRGYLKR